MRYTPFYCEENIWHLCADRAALGQASTVLLVTNPDRSCALFHQRAAAPGQPIIWDYHVILVAENDAQKGGPWVWDLDTRLSVPIEFAAYAARTFAPPGQLPDHLEPRFRTIAGVDWLARFSSDRAHMRTKGGRYREPPPTWPAIVVKGEASFLSWLDAGAAGPGSWTTLTELIERYGRTGE